MIIIIIVICNSLNKYARANVVSQVYTYSYIYIYIEYFGCSIHCVFNTLRFMLPSGVVKC